MINILMDSQKSNSKTMDNHGSQSTPSSSEIWESFLYFAEFFQEQNFFSRMLKALLNQT